VHDLNQDPQDGVHTLRVWRRTRFWYEFYTESFVALSLALRDQSTTRWQDVYVPLLPLIQCTQAETLESVQVSTAKLLTFDILGEMT